MSVLTKEGKKKVLDDYMAQYPDSEYIIPHADFVEQATIDAVVKMIEGEHVKQLNTATEHNYYAVLINKLKQDK